MSKKNTVSIRQKRFIDNKKELGYKRLQAYIPSDSYDKLITMKNNSDNNTIALVLESALDNEYKVWSKSNIIKD